MCMSCGCGAPDDNHGDERNITQDDLDRAAEAVGISREQAAQNMMSCCQPQRADDANQQNTGQERSASSGSAAG